MGEVGEYWREAKDYRRKAATFHEDYSVVQIRDAAHKMGFRVVCAIEGNCIIVKTPTHKATYFVTSRRWNVRVRFTRNPHIDYGQGAEAMLVRLAEL